jgi:hypothetical protein
MISSAHFNLTIINRSTDLRKILQNPFLSRHYKKETTSELQGRTPNIFTSLQPAEDLHITTSQRDLI